MVLKSHGSVWALSLVCTALLSACGGGGGGDSGSTSPAPTIAPTGTTVSPGDNQLVLSNSNYETAGNEAAASTFNLTDIGSAEMIGGAATTTSPQWTKLGMRYAPLAIEQATAPATLSGAIQTKTTACTNGGSVVTIANVDSDNLVETGESVAMVFNGCKESGIVMSGKLTFLFNKTVTGDLNSNVYSLDATMSFGSFTASDLAGTSVSADGDLRLAATRTAYRTGSDTVSSTSFTTQVTSGGASATRAISSFSSTTNFTSTETSTIVSGGTIVSTACEQKALKVYTASPFLQRYTESYPYSGSMVVTGSGSSSLTVSAVNTSQVKLDLDSNGDGMPDRSTVKTWSSIL